MTDLLGHRVRVRQPDGEVFEGPIRAVVGGSEGSIFVVASVADDGTTWLRDVIAGTVELLD
jgi:hypothetical protein